MRALGLPYMGGKRAIARDIATLICSRHPSVDLIYDLFGGGGSVSFAFSDLGRRVVYNDADPAISSLIDHLVRGGGLGEWATRWVTREEFHVLRSATWGLV